MSGMFGQRALDIVLRLFTLLRMSRMRTKETVQEMSVL